MMKAIAVDSVWQSQLALLNKSFAGWARGIGVIWKANLRILLNLN
jgi:hypothetical protein